MQNRQKRMRVYTSIIMLMVVLLSISGAYAEETGRSDIEYDDNGLTATEQQAGSSGGADFFFNWDWSGLGNFFRDLWDGTVDTLSSAWDATRNFFSDVGDMIADAWNALPDWAQDLIVTIGLIIAAVVAVIVLVVAGVITSIVVAVVAIVAAVIAGITYFALYGGTDQFNPFHAAMWIFGSALLGGLTAFLIEIGAMSALGSFIWNGLRWLGGSIWGGLRWLGGALWSGLRWLGGALWGGLRWLGGALWGGLRWLGGALWSGLRWLGGALWSGLRSLSGAVWGAIRGPIWGYIKTHFAGAAMSAFMTSIFNAYDILVNGNAMDWKEQLISIASAFVFGLIGGPLITELKIAFQAKSWATLAGLIGFSGFLGGMGNYIFDSLTGSPSWDNFAFGFFSSLIMLPYSYYFSGFDGGFAFDFAVDFGSSTLGEIVKLGWNHAGLALSATADFAAGVWNDYAIPAFNATFDFFVNFGDQVTSFLGNLF